MKKAKSFAPFITLVLSAALVAASAHWIRKAETPPWGDAKAESSAAADQPARISQAPPEGDFQPFTFVSYNVKNWLASTQTPEKSPEAKEAVISLLASDSPDVVGLCEIGGMEDLKEIQSMLAAEGVDLPHIHHTGGVDPVRHLALLSRLPIVATAKPDPRIPGTGRSMQRGILDATVRIAGRDIRFIGLHLKSKRSVQEFDEALLRVQEAGHARRHIDSILAENPDAMLVAYGDFNDTTRSLSTRTICGGYRTPGYLSPVHVKDSRGETWTHRYAVEDSYTRIDYVTVSAALRRHVKSATSRIIDDGPWEAASDHRPVLVRFE
ncbi:hypothetical protein HZ994_12385 [Akkermansiaceae bacterium]|nr:hypothetical protein HZ994_12385 [Akkermansiaceae bacterium]